MAAGAQTADPRRGGPLVMQGGGTTRHVNGDGRDILTHPANTAPIGADPFRLTSFNPSEAIVLKRFDRFWEFFQVLPALLFTMVVVMLFQPCLVRDGAERGPDRGWGERRARSANAGG